jgi:hypothetical protein
MTSQAFENCQPFGSDTEEITSEEDCLEMLTEKIKVEPEVLFDMIYASVAKWCDENANFLAKTVQSRPIPKAKQSRPTFLQQTPKKAKK